ncbi:MAG: PepSY domain-containing protein [Arenimonas sp.]
MVKLRIQALAVTFIFAAGATAALAHEPSRAQLRSQAKISEAAARTTALTKFPSGTIASAELEREHHRLIWSFDITRPGSRNVTEVQVDAKTGEIVSTQIETPRQEANEAAAESKQKGK